MNYENSLIHMTAVLESSESMYSLICLKATGLSLTLSGIRCYLDGYYLLCLSLEDTLAVHSGHYEAQTLHFRPYFYNVNLNHNVIGLSMYEEMRRLYGYPDFHLFRMRNEQYFGVLRLTSDEYEMAQISFHRAKQHINDHPIDGLWSCRTRSDMISILRIAEGAYLGVESRKGNEILRYIRDNLDGEITLSTLCERFHTNRTTLTEQVKELTGLSPMQYVLEERLNQSRPDLLFTWIPIQEVAEKYGFADANYYIRAFKKRFGLTPLQYRTQGSEERIRNETVYHEKERKMMKMEAFESYVCKGLGRAIILLREQTDKTPYRKPLIDLLTGDKIRGRFYGEYEKELIDCFEDRDVIVAEIAKALLSKIERGEYRLLAGVPLLIRLGYGDAVKEIADRQYRKSYAELLEFTRRGDSDEKYPTCAGEYFNAASVLARCVEADQMKQILQDIADLYQYSDHPVIPEYKNPLFAMMDGYGRDAFCRLIDEVVTEHPCGRKLEQHSPRNQLCTPYPLQPLENITTEEILASKFDEKYALRYLSFRQADESVVRVVAERILTEPDRKRQLHWLSFFTNAISPDLDPPAFPLDPTPLVEIVDEMKSSFFQDPHSPLADDASRYLDALQFMRHPSVKVLGKKMLDTQTCPNRFRNYALRMVYFANYTSEDRDALTALLLSEDSPDRNLFFRIYGDLIGRKTPDIPLELVPYVFEACVDHSARNSFVKALIEGDALSDEIKSECALDAAKWTRQLVMDL